MLAAGALLPQLFLPGFIGLADNGDFPKISMLFCTGPAGGDSQSHIHFVSTYERRPDFCWDSGLRSSAALPAWFASVVQQTADGRNSFDIRWLAAVYAVLFLLFFYVLLVAIRPLRGWRWVAASVAALWIFTDVGYIAYFNSFFADSAALVGAMTAAAAALWLLSLEEPRLPAVCLLAAGAVVFITSKSQHALFGLVPALLLAVAGRRAGKRAVRLTSWAAAVCVLASAAWMLAATPRWYQGKNRFNVISLEIAKLSSNPAADFRELGLSPADLKYAGMTAFTPGNPTENQQWFAAFNRRTSYGKLLAFYLRHPAMTLRLLRETLGPDAAGSRRPWNLGNFRREDNPRPAAQTERFASWSRLRDWLSRAWPTHVVAWYAVLAAGALLVLRRSASRFARALAICALGMAAIGAGEFSLAALCDAVETHRHLLLFHLCTDFTLFFALLWGLLDRHRNRAEAPVRNGTPTHV